MPVKTDMLKKFVVFSGQLVIIAFLSFIAREAWRGYGQEKENEQFARENVAVTVQVDRMLKDKRDWKDYIGYSKYIGFRYQGKSYDLRYLPDSGWVGEGTRVRLLYSSGLDRFLQPGRLRHQEPNVRLSKLIDWSVVGTFSPAHSWLFAFLALSTIIALFGFSVLFNVTGINFFDFLARIFKLIAALGLLTYFTWNVFSNYSYFSRVKTGDIRSVKVEETEKTREFRSTQADAWVFYYYTALVPDSSVAGKTRRIMISETDYEKFHKGDTMPVYNQASMNEMMSKDYRFELSKWFFLGIIWMIALYLVFSGLRSKKS